MIKELYSIYDEAVEAFGTPIAFNDEKECQEEIRRYLLSEEAANVDVKRYDVYLVGKYDTETGKFVNVEKPIHKFNTLVIKKGKENG